ATSDDALIDATGTYTVTASVDHVVHDLSVVAGATLDIIGGQFYVVGTDINSGIIHNYSILDISGLNNTGTIESVGGQVAHQTVIYVNSDGSNSGNMLATNDGPGTELGRIWFNPFIPLQFSNTGLIEAFGKGLIEIDLGI